MPAGLRKPVPGVASPGDLGSLTVLSGPMVALQLEAHPL